MDWLAMLLGGLGPGAAGAAGLDPSIVPPGTTGGGLPVPLPTERPMTAPQMDPMTPPAMDPQAMLPASSTPTSAPPVPIPVPRPANLGEALQPTAGPGAPMDIRPPAQQAGAQPVSPQANPMGAGGGADKMLAALRGVQAPPKPDVVKPSTPAAPTTRQIQGGDFLALLQALSNPRAGGGGAPMTLGSALGTGRY